MKKMTSILGIMTVLCFMIALVPAVSASDNVVIMATNPASFTFSIGTSQVAFPLTVLGQNDLTTSNMVNVASNVAWTMSGKDQMGNDLLVQQPTSAGHMHLLNAGGTAHLSSFLTNPLYVAVNGNYVAMSGTNQVIHTGTAETFSAPLKLRQTTTIADPATSGTQKYDFVMVVTGAAVP